MPIILARKKQQTLMKFSQSLALLSQCLIGRTSQQTSVTISFDVQWDKRGLNYSSFSEDKCQLCQSQDLPVLPRGNSKLCTQCLNADLELPAPPAKPVLPSSKQSTPSLSPKGARKSVLDSVLSRTAASDSRPGYNLLILFRNSY